MHIATRFLSHWITVSILSLKYIRTPKKKKKNTEEKHLNLLHTYNI